MPADGSSRQLCGGSTSTHALCCSVTARSNRQIDLLERNPIPRLLVCDSELDASVRAVTEESIFECGGASETHAKGAAIRRRLKRPPPAETLFEEQSVV